MTHDAPGYAGGQAGDGAGPDAPGSGGVWAPPGSGWVSGSDTQPVPSAWDGGGASPYAQPAADPYRTGGQAHDPHAQPGSSPAPAPQGPGEPGANGPDGPGVGGPGEPVVGAPRGLRAGWSRRPGWPGVLTAAVVAALVGGGAAVGIDHASHTDDGFTATPASGSGSGSAGSGSAGGSGGSSGAAASVPLTTAVAWNQVAAKVKPSVATIEVSSGDTGAEGTGIILDTTGHVLTNNHVATAAGTNADIRIILSDGRVYTGKITGTDSQTDLAVLQIQKAPSDLQPATFGDSDTVAVGQPVMAVGNPLGLSDTVTTGIISATNRPVTTTSDESPSQDPSQEQDPFGLGGLGGSTQTPSQAQEVVTNALQTDAAINPGNSGGPLVNAAGQVIGINSSIASTSDTSDETSQSGSIGLGFAIPSSEAQRVAHELLTTGKASHALLGVTLSGEDGTATVAGTTRQAAIVAGVTSGAAADKAGIRKGDAITAIDGTSVTGADALTAEVHSRAPGDRVVLTVVRDGQQKNISVALGAKPGS